MIPLLLMTGLKLVKKCSTMFKKFVMALEFKFKVIIKVDIVATLFSIKRLEKGT